MITTLITTEQFAGNGSTETPYVLPFKILSGSHLRVEVTHANGETTALDNGVDFVVTGAGGDSFSFTTVEAWPDTDTLTATVRMPLTQETNLENHSRFDAEVLERRLDYLTLLIQLAASGSGFNGDRAILFPASDPRSQTQYLPNAVQRKDTVVFFDPVTGEMQALRLDQLAQRLLVILGAEAVLPYRTREVSGSITIEQEDVNVSIRVNAVEDAVITLPETADFSDNFFCTVSKFGIGAVEFDAPSGVIIESAGDKTRIFDGKTPVGIQLIGVNRWWIFGDLY